jgi:hypothetical protein
VTTNTTDPQPKMQCRDCLEWYPATARYFPRDASKTATGGLFPKCKTCKQARARDSQMSPQDKIAERCKLQAQVSWFLREMPKYLSTQELTDLRKQAITDLDFDPEWERPAQPVDDGPRWDDIDEINDFG